MFLGLLCKAEHEMLCCYAMCFLSLLSCPLRLNRFSIDAPSSVASKVAAALDRSYSIDIDMSAMIDKFDQVQVALIFLFRFSLQLNIHLEMCFVSYIIYSI